MIHAQLSVLECGRQEQDYREQLYRCNLPGSPTVLKLNDLARLVRYRAFGLKKSVVDARLKSVNRKCTKS